MNAADEILHDIGDLDGRRQEVDQHGQSHQPVDDDEHIVPAAHVQPVGDHAHEAVGVDVIPDMFVEVHELIQRQISNRHGHQQEEHPLALGHDRFHEETGVCQQAGSEQVGDRKDGDRAFFQVEMEGEARPFRVQVHREADENKHCYL